MAKDKKRGFFSWLGIGSQDKQESSDSDKKEIVSEHCENVAEKTPSSENDLHSSDSIELVEEFEHEVEIEQQTHHETPCVADSIVESHESTELVEQFEHDKHVEPQAPHDLSPVFDEPIESHEVTELVTELETKDVPQPAVIAEEAKPKRGCLTSLMDEFEHDDKAQQQQKQQQEKPAEKEGFFSRLKKGLLRTKQNLGSGFLNLFRNRKIDDELFEELEEQLLIADVGVNTSQKIIHSLTERVDRKKLHDAQALYDELKSEMTRILDEVSQPLDVTSHSPFVILMIGVNGVGKTTTIGKLARQFQQQGKSVMLAAGDTFRAAAVEQLQVWGERNNIPVIAQQTGSDSASVIFDALQAAKARKIDILIADTAGRLQNKAHLMEELKKIVRVMQKLDAKAPHEVMLTIDASTGQNAVSQAKLFNEAIGLTGITLTKLDGTAKGGVIFAIADQFKIPIRYIGVGESIEDLRPFQSKDFIEALFAQEE